MAVLTTTFRCGEYRYNSTPKMLFRDGSVNNYYEHSANASALWIPAKIGGHFQGSLHGLFSRETEDIGKLRLSSKYPTESEVGDVLAHIMQSDMSEDAHYKLDGYRISQTQIAIHSSPPEWVELSKLLLDADLYQMEFQTLLRAF